MFSSPQATCRLGVAFALVLFGFASTAKAEQYTQTISPKVGLYDAQGYRQTNFTDTTTFTVDQFNQALGALTSIDVSLDVTIRTGIQIENEDPVARTADATVAGTFFLRRPNNTNLIITGPVIQTGQVSLAAYDGVTDYLGASAYNFGTLFSDMNTESVTLNSVNDLALFTGTGTLTMPVVGIVGGSVNGPGNASVRTTSASAPIVTVTYHYNPSITAAPEPASLGLLGVGLVFACANRTRRRK